MDITEEIKMKIQPGFALKEVADSFVIVPTGANIVDFSLFTTSVIYKKTKPLSIEWLCGAYGTRTRDPMRDRHVF